MKECDPTHQALHALYAKQDPPLAQSMIHMPQYFSKQGVNRSQSKSMSKVASTTNRLSGFFTTIFAGLVVLRPRSGTAQLHWVSHLICTSPTRTHIVDLDLLASKEQQDLDLLVRLSSSLAVAHLRWIECEC